MDAKKRISIEKRAHIVRGLCNVTGYGFQNIFESCECEKLDYKLIRYPLGENGILGCAQIKDNDKVIFTNSSVILAREIFSVAHEIGHHELHLNHDCAMIRDVDFSDRDARESEANYFAACLLMPEEEIQKFIRYDLMDKSVKDWSGLDIARFQTAFNVSFDMALTRLESMGLINAADLVKFQSQKSETTVTRLLQIIGGTTELCQVTNAKKVPAQFIEWVMYNYKEKLIPRSTLEKAFSYFDISPEEVIQEDAETPKDDESLDDLIGGLDE